MSAAVLIAPLSLSISALPLFYLSPYRPLIESSSHPLCYVASPLLGASSQDVSFKLVSTSWLPNLSAFPSLSLFSHSVFQSFSLPTSPPISLAAYHPRSHSGFSALTNMLRVCYSLPLNNLVRILTPWWLQLGQMVVNAPETLATWMVPARKPVENVVAPHRPNSQHSHHMLLMAAPIRTSLEARLGLTSQETAAPNT